MSGQESMTVPLVCVYSGDTKTDWIEGLRKLYSHRELLLTWTSREVKVRYKQSVLGIAWAILQPFSMMVVFSIIFTHIIRLPTEGAPYPLFSYVALLPWTLFTTAITTGASSVVSNLALVTKINFPREILPLAQIGAAGFDFLVASLLFLGMMLFYRLPMSWSFLAVPGLLLIQMTLMGGLVLLASAMTARFRDIRFVVPLAMQLWMYATPIIYPLSLVPERWQWAFHLNPMATIIEGYRGAILYSRLPSGLELAWAATISVLILVIGYGVFKRTEVWFADLM